MKKLSELEMGTMLTVGTGETIMTKEDFLETSDFIDYAEFTPVTVAEKSTVTFDLDRIIDYFDDLGEVYEGWSEDVYGAIKGSKKWKIIEEAFREIQRIFNEHPTYWEGKDVEIDMSPK